jgi:hypothetical protein
MGMIIDLFRVNTRFDIEINHTTDYNVIITSLRQLNPSDLNFSIVKISNPNLTRVNKINYFTK